MIGEKKILIIGAGSLGSRHLQSLASIPYKINIDIIDRFEKSLDNAKTIINDNFHPQTLGLVNYYSDIMQIQGDTDLAIIATTADVRFEIVSQLLNHTRLSNLILEKVLFQKMDHYDRVSNLLNKNNINAYVNCPRRMYSFYKTIKEEFDPNKPVHLTVTGGNWGLGCNSIHFFDLWNYFNLSQILELNLSGIDNSIQKSKRDGFIEFSGRLQGYAANGSRIYLSADPEIVGPALIVLEQGSIKYIISEGLKKLIRMDGSSSFQEISIEVPFQSQLTGIAVSQIFSENSCELTEYEESSDLHKKLIYEFIKILQKNNPLMDSCPIT